MTPARWSQIKEVFSAALETPDSERPRFLESACDGDADLRAEVERLLAGNQEPSWQSPAAKLFTAAIQLAPGDMVARYRIVEKIGAGGMGDVYRARDEHLSRDVAIKVLGSGTLTGKSARKHFLKEARILSQLNHPNIATIHDFDTQHDVDFLVMEYIPGITLSEELAARPMLEKEVIRLGIQLAEGLAVAHDHGIVHRDLKPGNLRVTSDGRLKILDFGLAKLRHPVAESAATESSSETHTMAGTLPYMAPEQLLGGETDARTDIHAAGCVLYEMATGQRPFADVERSQLIGAILHRPPLLATALNPRLSLELERIVGKCLEKEPEDRYQSAKELAIDLRRPQTGVASAVQLAAAPARWPFAKRVGLGLGIVASVTALLLAAGAWWVLSRTAKPEPPLVAVPLTTYPGSQDAPSFSPDGTQVAFEWCRDIRVPTCHIYIKQVGVDPPFQLTDKPEEDESPAWSPDGRTVAFVRDLAPNRLAVVLIPQRGGHERVIEEQDLGILGGGPVVGGPYLAWSPDSKWIACPLRTDKRAWGLSLISVETGEKRRLTNPPAGMYHGDTTPAFSADGRTLAFSREGLTRYDVYLLHLAEGYRPQGEPERMVLNNAANFGAAWTPDGHDLVFSSGTYNSFGLWRIPAKRGAEPRRLAFASDHAFAPTISRLGNRLAYVVGRGDTNIWRVDLRGPARKPGNPVQFISSTLSEYEPRFSSDGKRIAFVSARSGSYEIWVCDADASNIVQLTSFGGVGVHAPRWSLDGGDVAFGVPVSRQREYIYLVSAKGGKPRRLTAESAAAFEGSPDWSRDGRWIYFISDRSGRIEVWRMPSKGGEAVQITRNEADQVEVSPDGRFLYYSKGWPRQISLWRMPVEGGEEVKVLDSMDPDGRWALGREGVYFFTPPDKQGHSDIRLYELSAGKIRKILTIERAIGSQIAVSPDGRTILYTQLDEAGSDLMMVENFH